MTLLLAGLGILLISLASVVIWRNVSRLGIKWFGVGALLWAVAVPPKILFFWLGSPRVLGPLKEGLPYAYFIAAAGLFVGIVSSAFEVGVTWGAARIWPRLGRDAGRAIAIGLGAGAFEALLLGLAALGGALAIAMAADAEDTEEILRIAATTPLFWLVPPVERLFSLLGHASTRALVVLGVAKGKPLMVCWGFLLFAATDGVGGAFLVTGSHESHPWLAELAASPDALIGIPILWWCYRRWRDGGEVFESRSSG